MGCFNETCMLTNLPILAGESVYAILLETRRAYHVPCGKDQEFISKATIVLEDQIH